MSLAVTSSLEGGSSVDGSDTAASISVPQPAPVQPPRRSQAESVVSVRSMKQEVKEHRGMALNISPAGERSNLPGCSDRVYHLLERHGTPQSLGQRSRAARVADVLLRAAEQNGTMLQKGVPAAHLRRADELLAVHEDLAADGKGEAGARMGRWADGRMGWCERGIRAERPQGSSEPGVDLAIRFP